MTRRAGLVLVALALVALGLAVPGRLGAPAQAAPAASAASAASAAGKAKDGYRATKELTRVFANADGTSYSFPTHRVTVTADKTRNLRGRQRIRISWKGAQPSGGRASNPYGENGLAQEYPVVVLQCRGVDDPSVAAGRRLRPETCWTASVAQRSQVTRSEGEATWRHDLYADAADKARVSGVAPFPGAEECPTADIDPYATRLTPFVARGGRTYLACDAEHMPPEAAVGAAFPPAEIAAFTEPDGTGSVQLEVRSDTENESLGCNHEVACSVVVIPIVGLSCDAPSEPATAGDQACRKGGRFAPGSSNYSNEGIDQAVGPALWWAESNWRNRFAIPITFGLPPDTCDIRDPRPPTGFYGSELLAQAATQWSPAYCLAKDRFKYQLNQMSDEAGWNLMESGGGAAAAVSSEHQRRGTDPVGYAPTAVTGFSIAYVVDEPDNGGEYSRLRLNARLVAKLMTQSYLGSDLGRGHPGIGGNPLAIMNDPEFQQLNPGLSTTTQEAGAALLSLSNSSDVVEQVTAYLAEDPDARAFLSGKPDKWGMKVNPEYEGIEVPRSEWPLLDTYVPETENTCRQENPAVYFTQLAAPVTTLRKISEALLDAWPNVQTRCELDQSAQQYKLGRVDRQSFGSRFMLGITSLGDAARYGLRSAALETKPGRYVAPTDASLGAAVRLAEQAEPMQPFVLDQADVRKDGAAYPGTMVVYTAARLRNLPKADATKVAQFIRVSTTEGQRPGSGNGELPEGYLPIRRTGVTAKLFRSAQRVADAVAAQREPAGGGDTSGGGSGGGDTSGGGTGLPGGDVPVGDVPTGEVPGADEAPGADEPAPPATAAPVMPATEPVGSRLGGGLLPALVLVGLVSVLGASGLRFFVRVPR
ncbi:hypothetical protein [Nocardioides sp. Arc9.136]|uniref:hypothetical protein n=1 Tax=Nocardioides sp. Arc9.136 TaxID=2996826 RepID=UPI002666D541|nr:hypothetical protein [Nocardioides sp. Arc9.136]WKN48716.1 hypothetical protein OSR43_00920 [Nocardioides sp. Arc9.136]